MSSQTLYSAQDSSVNFVDKQNDGGAFESRYVRREADYFIAYLSSHTGCNKACRFCHLTATKQTTMRSAMMIDFQSQAVKVMGHYDTQLTAKRVHYNFMARGEPLANEHLLTHWPEISDDLAKLATRRNLTPKFNISTVMPGDFSFSTLKEAFDTEHRPVLYYSLYSMRPDFRKRWLPKAMDPNKALDKLAAWQQHTGSEVVLHWSFIEGQNDDEQTLEDIIAAVGSRDLRVKFNLVRYNAFSSRQGKEPTDAVLHRNFNLLKQAFGDDTSRIVPRVGFDVAASCGMFIDLRNDERILY